MERSPTRRGGGLNPRRPTNRWIAVVAGWLVIPGLFFGAFAPTLTWQEFSGSMENLNIATALELRRDHPAGGVAWLTPTLEGEARVKKPPLTAWLTAAAIRPDTVEAMSSRDAAVRQGAWTRLAWQSRWPSLLAACVMLIAVFELGRVIAGRDSGNGDEEGATRDAVGIVAAIACGTMLLFVRYGRTATTDVHLGLWSSIATVFVAHAILEGRRWVGCIGAGAAMGIGAMAKGPLPLVYVLLPAIAYGIVRLVEGYRRRARRGEAEDMASEWAADAPRATHWALPVVVGLLVLLAIGLPWYVWVAKHVQGGAESWRQQLTENDDKPGKPWTYVSFFAYAMPWLIFIIAGALPARPSSRTGPGGSNGMGGDLAGDATAEEPLGWPIPYRRVLLAFMLVIVPLIGLTLYKDRHDRYLYPLAAPAGVLAAVGLVNLARKREPLNKLDRAAIAQHWLLLVLIGVIFPAVAATHWIPALRRVDGTPWLSRGTGAAMTISMGLLIAGAMVFRRRWAEMLVTTTLVVLLATQWVGMKGYANTTAGRADLKPLAEAIWRTCPDAEMWNAHPEGKRASVDLSIYLNRRTRRVAPADIGQVKPSGRPQVVVMLQRPKWPVPRPEAPGWEYLVKGQRDVDYWHAYVLRPKKD